MRPSNLNNGSKARKKLFDFDFAELEIKGRGAGGNTLTKYPVKKVTLKEAGTMFHSMGEIL